MTLEDASLPHRSALLLVGHGSSRRPDASAPIRRLADRLAAEHRFARIETCFWKEPPFIGQGLDRIAAPEIFVVPVFAAEGEFTRVIVPRELGLTGPLTVRPDGRRIHYCRPVGTHPRVTNLILARADDVIASERLAPDTIALFLVGHGNKRGGGARTTVDELAQTLDASGRYGEVRAVFLEEEPLAASWSALTDRSNIIVLPLLMAEGQHGGHELPLLFGLPADLPDGESVIAGTCQGRRIWFCRGIADAEALADIILDLVRETR